MSRLVVIAQLVIGNCKQNTGIKRTPRRSITWTETKKNMNTKNSYAEKKLNEARS